MPVPSVHRVDIPNLGPIIPIMGTNPINLSEALFSKTRARVLGLLFGQADRSFYLTDIMRRANVGRGSVQRELERLVAAGLVTVRKMGNQRHYQANPRTPIFNELQGIIYKTAGIADAIRDALADLDSRLDQVFIFGSLAAGTARMTSDIDLMVVGDVSFTEIVTALIDTHESLNREVNPVVMKRGEFQKKARNQDRFVSRILKEPKIFVKGSENELGELAEYWTTS